MSERWPGLQRPDWEGTRDHLRLWAQIVGKTRLAFAPHVNHWWQVALYVSPRGLTTSAIPTPDGRHFDLELDLLSHRLVARTSDERSGTLLLERGAVADFYARYRELLGSLDVHPRIFPQPVESVECIPFEQDSQLRPYDPVWATSYLGALREIERVLQIFRGAFIGKASPVHYFWGSGDLAVTRFSGRTAPRHPGGIPNCPDRIAVEAYSHECSSAGFWPGGGGYAEPAMYSYAYPEPSGYADTPALPAGAFYSQELHEYLLPYEALRKSDNPARAALTFLQATYVSAAQHGRWHREDLERPVGATGKGGVPWLRDASTSSGTSEHPPA